MQRIPEPELMEDEGQARAYALADFEEPHNRFVELFRDSFPGLDVNGHVLDLGCGPGDISIRFARAFPHCMIHGVDGSKAMLKFGVELLAKAPEVIGRVQLLLGYLPDASLPRRQYDIIISNSLLHHLAEPKVMWQTVRRHADAETPVFIMDLMRPQSVEMAATLVEQNAAGEPEILRRDFYKSLLAAYQIDEVREQLKDEGLTALDVRAVSDRHLVVSGLLE